MTKGKGRSNNGILAQIWQYKLSATEMHWARELEEELQNMPKSSSIPGHSKKHTTFPQRKLKPNNGNLYQSDT